MTRREFVGAGGVLLSGVAMGQAPSVITAGEVIARIKSMVGVPWREKTVDNLLTGSLDMLVTGVATTMMATLDVVERCAAQGKNLIVTHETPFYLHQDHTDDIQNDATLLYKQDFCRKNNIGLFHFHDHWHAHRPDGIAQGMIEQLGWQKYVETPANPSVLTFDGITLGALAKQMTATLNAQTIRVIGDPATPLHHGRTSWGYCGREGGIAAFARPDVDVFLCGETREWEFVEYAQDCIRAGNEKGLIIVGHVLSEQGGMILCANWLKGFVTEVPVGFVAAAEPCWSPNLLKA